MKIAEWKKASKGLIRKPLDPDYMRLVEVMTTSNAPAALPGPTTPWTQTYHLFCCRGFWTANVFTGALILEAPEGMTPDGEWVLRGKKLLHDGVDTKRGKKTGDVPAVNRFDFEVTMKGWDPVLWKTRQAIIRYDEGRRREIRSTVLHKNGQAAADSWTVTTAGRFQKRVPRTAGVHMRSLVGCMAEASLWQPKAGFSMPLELLQEFAVLRPEGRVDYSGTARTSNNEILHAFVLQSRGTLPYDFWLDDQQRLVACIQGSYGPAVIPVERSVWTPTSQIQKEMGVRFSFKEKSHV